MPPVGLNICSTVLNSAVHLQGERDADVELGDVLHLVVILATITAAATAEQAFMFRHLSVALLRLSHLVRCPGCSGLQPRLGLSDQLVSLVVQTERPPDVAEVANR